MFSNKSSHIVKRILFGSLIKAPFGYLIKIFGSLTAEKFDCGKRTFLTVKKKLLLKQMLTFTPLRHLF